MEAVFQNETLPLQYTNGLLFFWVDGFLLQLQLHWFWHTNLTFFLLPFWFGKREEYIYLFMAHMSSVRNTKGEEDNIDTRTITRATSTHVK